MPRRRLSPTARIGPLVRGGAAAEPLKGELVYPGMRIGLYGGSFDPVHEGHLHVAETAMRRLQLDRVWWIVSPRNPLKNDSPRGYEQRLAKVAEAASRPGFVVSDLERRLDTPYTADVVAALTARHPAARFVWIMGADNLAQLHRWRAWRGIMRRVPVAVVARPGESLRAQLSHAAKQFRHARVDPAHARALPAMKAPAWLYLTARLNPASSTALRSKDPAPR